MNKIVFLLTFIVFTSCSQKKENANNSIQPEPNDNQISEIEKSNTAELNEEVSLGNYKGKIGTNLDVVFHLEDENGKVSGFYYYEKTGIDISIHGHITKDTLIVYELDFKKDTTALIKGTIKESGIQGKWVSGTTKKEYPLTLDIIRDEVQPLPTTIEGKYYDEMCGLTLSVFKSKGAYFYEYSSSERNLKGKIRFIRGDELYINLENIEYAEDYFDVSLAEEDPEKSKEYERLKKIGKRKIGVECLYTTEEILIQNYGNAMNYYVKLYDCGEKYIHFKKQ
ncbi:hypothetical protein [Aquimarina sp. SS2-1]|uniref:hypothetical protein n=1 Tax=Aquimarina besae TaxID=3342247 RepID=UPI0036722340